MEHIALPAGEKNSAVTVCTVHHQTQEPVYQRGGRVAPVTQEYY